MEYWLNTDNQTEGKAPGKPRTITGSTITGIVIGRIEALRGGAALVSHPLDAGAPPCPAWAMVPLADLCPGDEVALMFEGGDPARPVLMGRMEVQSALAAASVAVVDTEQSVIEHPSRLVLKCGKASVTLSADGKIELAGDYLLSTSRGLNRIAGASVKIN